MKILGTKEVAFNVTPGHFAELQFTILAWNKSWQVAKPLFDEAPYDFVVMGIDNTAQWCTVQVKKAYEYHGRYRLDIRKNGPSKSKIHYGACDFDYLFVWIDDFKDWYIIPYKYIRHIKCEINIISSKWAKFKLSKESEQK